MLDAITNRLYILFGFYDNSLGPQNTPLIALNVSSPSALAFLDLTQQAMIDPNSSPNVTVLADVKNGINSATIGGAVGGTIGVSDLLDTVDQTHTFLTHFFRVF